MILLQILILTVILLYWSVEYAGSTQPKLELRLDGVIYLAKFLIAF